MKEIEFQHAKLRHTVLYKELDELLDSFKCLSKFVQDECISTESDYFDSLLDADDEVLDKFADLQDSLDNYRSSIIKAFLAL